MQKRWFKVLTGVVFMTFILATLVEAQEDGQRRRRDDRQGGGQREGRGGRGAGQFGGRGNFGPRGGGDLLGLIRIEEVRKEIKLDKSQEESVDEIAKKLRGERGERPNFRDLSEEERTKFFAERREAAKKRAVEAKKMLAGVLNEDQMKRLNEIKLQVQGIAALNDDEVAAKLEITDEQQGKIDAVEEKNREEMLSAFRDLRGSGDREAARKKMTELRESAEKNVMAVLTKEQQAKFAEMKGKKFDMPRRRFGGRGRGDRQRGNRGQGNDS